MVYTWQGAKETDKKPYEAIMNLNHSDALSVSTNRAPLTKGTSTQDNSGFSDNEEDNSNFSDNEEDDADFSE